MAYVEVDMSKNTLTSNNMRLNVRPMVAELAELFAARPPATIVTRQEIIDGIWARPIMSDEPVSQLIYTLRKNLTTLGVCEPLKTVRKRGFALREGVVFVSVGGNVSD